MLIRLTFLTTLTTAASLAWTPCLGGQPDRPVAVTAVLAEAGRAKQTIVVGPETSETTQLAAQELADYLGCISGATFEVTRGSGTTGVAVGVDGDFPGLKLDGVFASDDPLRRDDYLIRSHADGVYVIGASETAVTLAVWDLLHRLGYRLFFLTDTWEVVPERSDLPLAVDTVERPDYVTRRAPRGAPWSDTQLWDRWRRRNRVLCSFQLDTGHSYGRIFRAKREQFAMHPRVLCPGRRPAVFARQSRRRQHQVLHQQPGAAAIGC